MTSGQKTEQVCEMLLTGSEGREAFENFRAKCTRAFAVSELQTDRSHGNEYSATSPARAIEGSKLTTEDKLPPRTPNLTLFAAAEVPLEA